FTRTRSTSPAGADWGAATKTRLPANHAAAPKPCLINSRRDNRTRRLLRFIICRTSASETLSNATEGVNLLSCVTIAAYSMADVTPFLLSLPERALRSVTALAAGLLREIGEVAIPKTIRRGQLYRNMVDATLRFLIEQVGGVEGVYPTEEKLAEDFLLRRT